MERWELSRRSQCSRELPAEVWHFGANASLRISTCPVTQRSRSKVLSTTLYDWAWVSLCDQSLARSPRRRPAA
jgi:hypothetical protein